MHLQEIMVIFSLKARTSLLAVEKFFLVLFVAVVILILEHAPPTDASHSAQFIVISICFRCILEGFD